MAGECAGAAARRQSVPSRRKAAGGARHGADAAGGCLAALRGRARPGQRAGLHPPRRCRWAPPTRMCLQVCAGGFPLQRLNHQTISRGSTCGVHRHVCKIKMYCELGDEVVVTSCRCSMCMHGQGGRRCSEACSACERAPPPRRLSAWHIRVSLIPSIFPGAAWNVGELGSISQETTGNWGGADAIRGVWCSGDGAASYLFAVTQSQTVVFDLRATSKVATLAAISLAWDMLQPGSLPRAGVAWW